jgi:argininosuccinate lyase
VVKGTPFREAHAIAGKAVRVAAEKGTSLDKLDLNEWQAMGAMIEADVYAVFDPQKSVEKRSATGGTAPAAVQKQIEQARAAHQNVRAGSSRPDQTK